MVKVFAKDKHSNLLQKFVKYVRKKSYNIGPRRVFYISLSMYTTISLQSAYYNHILQSVDVLCVDILRVIVLNVDMLSVVATQPTPVIGAAISDVG